MDIVVAVRQNSIVLVPGPVRCGKTAGAVTAFMMWASGFTGEQFAIIAPVIRQVKDVVVPAMQEAFGTDETIIVQGGNERPTITVRGNEFLIFGSSDSQSITRMRGYEFRGAYYDEVSERPNPDMYEFLLGRCSVEPMRIVATCNPKGPHHWVKRQLIDRMPDGVAHIPFSIDDNPHLPEVWKRMMRESLTGVNLKRDYYGEWAAAEGAVYPEYRIDAPPDTSPVAQWWAADYGTSSPTHVLQFAEYEDGSVWVIDEYRSDPGDAVDVQYANMKGRFHGNGFLDPTAAPLRVYLQDRGVTVYNAQSKPVNDGIALTSLVLKQGKLCISRNCGELIKEMDNYSWDANKVDTVIKRDDHACDALRYGTMAWFTLTESRNFSLKMDPADEQH